MAIFKVETKNKVDIDKKPRVYFTCHPEDFEKHFKKICDDIFKTHDCAIYYTANMTEVIADDEKDVDLGRNNLFVIPVTFKLLTTPNRAMNEDIPYALKEHIPVLPIMMEPGIDEFYSKPDKFGELQYLNPYSTDLTEISYEEKLKKYLESVLISDELAKRVRAAFDAYIFLSYRKKDRKYANELMRLIHKNEFCRNMAIWYDEFLTPGENFNDAIKEALKKSGLFVLAITPNLINEQNYIMTAEYPLAKREGKPILPAELVPTDREILLKKYEGIPNPTDAYNDAEFSKALRDSVQKMNIKENVISSEHNFFIGLAYLDGIDVEVDHERAVSLISVAARDGLVQAMDKLVEMYRNGKGVKRDYIKAIEWQQKKTEKMTRDIELCTDQSKYVSVFDEMLLLGDYYKEISNYTRAEEDYKKAQNFVKRFKQTTINERMQVKICRCEAMGRLGNLLLSQEKSLIEAKQWCLHYVWGYEELFNDTKEERFIEKIAYGYMRLGDIFYITADYKNAQTCYERCHKYAISLCQRSGSDFTIETGEWYARNLVLRSYINLGNLEIEKGEYAQAESYYMRALSFTHDLEKEDSSLKTIDNIIVCNNALAKVKLIESDSFMAYMFSSKALEYAERMFNDTNTYYAKTKLLECYCQNARCLIENKRYGTARIILEKAHLINEELLLEGEMPQTKLRTSDICECWGEIYSYENNNNEALINFKRCMKIRQELCMKECPKYFYEALAQAYCNMVRVYGEMYISSALDVYDILTQSYISSHKSMPKRQFMAIVKIVKDYFLNTLDISSEYSEADDYPNRVMKIYIAVADEYMLKGDNSIVYSFLLRATKIKEKLSRKTNDKATKRELANLYLKTANICEKVGDQTNAKKYRDAGLYLQIVSF